MVQLDPKRDFGFHPGPDEEMQKLLRVIAEDYDVQASEFDAEDPGDAKSLRLSARRLRAFAAQIG